MSKGKFLSAPSKKMLLLGATLLFGALSFAVSANNGQAGTTLEAKKTATGFWTTEYGWTINKSVSPERWEMFKGDSGTSLYTVSVTKDEGTSVAYVKGKITVTNGGEVATEGLKLVDQVEYKTGSGQHQDLPGATQTQYPDQLEPGETGVYDYNIEFTPIPGATYRNVVYVSITNHSGELGNEWTISPKADFELPSSPTLVNDSVSVADTNGSGWNASDDAIWTYPQTFTCDSDEGKKDNKATITQTGQFASASVDVSCYDINVTKDAETKYTRTHNWNIDKSVNPETINMFLGDSHEAKYEVKVEKTDYTDSKWMVEGKINIVNPAPISAELNSVSDIVGPDIPATVDCEVVFPYSLAPDDSLECSYVSSPPDDAKRTNTATATIQNYDYHYKNDPVKSSTTNFSGTAEVIFGDPTTVVNKDINVVDTNGKNWATNKTEAWNYKENFSCPADISLYKEGYYGYTKNNTASITETGQSSAAKVTVNCYLISIAKTADTSYTKKWSWTIDKWADESALTLATGQIYPVNYSVKVDASSADSNWASGGKIDISNPAPIAATLSGVSDVITGPIVPTLDCGVSFPHTLAAGGTITCNWSASLPDAQNRTNTAKATQQNHNYDYLGVGTENVTIDYTATADIDFSKAVVTEIDEMIDVSDSYKGFLGAVDSADAPKTFNYSRSFEYNACGLFEEPNIASFLTNDTATTGSDNWSITIDVPCNGCTLTQGYWKTHSEYGPAPYDEAWALLDGGADTDFFRSGKTWHQVFWTPPAGNVYYNLAHQYMAAKLNTLNEASAPAEVTKAIKKAEEWFEEYTPEEVSKLKGKQKEEWTKLAATLDKYNNGLIGPGHCDEK